MATYVYQCPKRHVTECTHQSMEKGPTQDITCYCGFDAQLQYTAPGVVFKGPGFYSTDNKSTDHLSEE